MKHKLKSRLPGEIAITSDIEMTPHLTTESKEELKSLLMEVKEEGEKVCLKLNIQKMKIMASGPMTSWLIDEGTMIDFIFWGSKITADGDCSHEIKSRLLPGKKVMTNLDSILKSRDREQDGREVGGRGLHLSHRIHQKNIFRHTSACRTPAESGQEDLTSRREYTEPCKTR